MLRTSALALALLLPLTSCGGDDGDDSRLTVLAASSLTEVFTELGDAFEEEHDGVEVRFSFGSSTTLADQAGQGAPGDVLATADETAMAIAGNADVLTADAVVFAENQMVLVVPADNPAEITSYADLKGTDWVRCADDVPCGGVANKIIALNDAMGGFKVNPNRAVGDPASLEVDVKSVLAKVTSGEADAGFVYATDAKVAGDDVKVFDLPHSSEALTKYYIAPLDQAGDDTLARDWVGFVLSTAGQEALSDAGFRVDQKLAG